MVQVLHSNEKEQFRKLFQRNKIDQFEKRFTILEFFLRTEKHITLTELSEVFVSENITIESKLLVDTMDMMCRYGFARRHRFDDGVIRYEHMHLGHHHDHMICVKCGSILEFKDDRLEKLQIDVAVNHGFHVLQHRMDLYGICQKCVLERDKLSCMDDATQGEKLIIVKILGGKKSVLRLASLGLRIGDEIDVIMNSGKGQLVIALGCKRLVLSREIVEKILVQAKVER